MPRPEIRACHNEVPEYGPYGPLMLSQAVEAYNNQAPNTYVSTYSVMI